MIPKECKRLAEVDFPIAVVSRHSAREKSIRHGHPSTLHLWWARRPLAACRAMLMALLLPDPCDPNCLEEFKTRARDILPRVQGRPGAKDIDLRNELLRFIGDFANWDNSSNATYLEAARGLVRVAHGEDAPLVVDPFAGGGSIPLEALRLGCDTFASDLNPVACLIIKTLLEDVPRHGFALANELRKAGAEIKSAATKDLLEFYPSDADGSRPIAYLWARTITCDSCQAELPLIRSLWLCDKAKRKRALRYTVERSRGLPPKILFAVFSPQRDELQSGTVTRARAVCPACNTVMPPDRVRVQLRAQRGGAETIFDANGNRVGGARLLAVVALKDDSSGRHYRAAREEDYVVIRKARDAVRHACRNPLDNGLDQIPTEMLPPTNTNSFRVPNYGVLQWKDLFTSRQQLTLLTLSRLVRTMSAEAGTRNAAIKAMLGIVVSRCADASSSLSAWRTTVECNRATFARQALSMVWDFCETMPLTDAAGGYDNALEWVAQVVENVAHLLMEPGQTQQSDACESPLPNAAANIWFTDPPYYDAVGYAELSDFFFIWLKRALFPHSLLKDPYDPSNPLVHKARECVQDEAYSSVDGHPKDRVFFERTMAAAFGEGRRLLRDDGVGCVVFAHKTTEGWESLLTGMIRGGWIIGGSWPISTERPGRLRSQDSAALATSVHLICRPRAEDAPIGDWGDVLRELPQRVGDWIERLQVEGIKGADLVFACIGPAMEIYSRYRRVEDAEGREIPLGGDPIASEPYQRGFLAYVWETVGRLALEEVLGTAEAKARNGASGALEEDSRLTALFLWTLQTTEANLAAAIGNGDLEEIDDEEEESTKPKKKNGYTLIYDVVRRFAQPLGIHLEKWEGRIIETEKGIVRLLPVTERAATLFGEADAAAISRRIEEDSKTSRNLAFSFMQDVAAAPEIKGRGRGRKPAGAAAKSGEAAAAATAPQPATTLDRLHAAMLLQRSGQTNGLRALLKEEMQRGPDFLRLANALSRLYPKDSEEKRLLDAMVLAIPKN